MDEKTKEIVIEQMKLTAKRAGFKLNSVINLTEEIKIEETKSLSLINLSRDNPSFIESFGRYSLTELTDAERFQQIYETLDFIIYFNTANKRIYRWRK